MWEVRRYHDTPDRCLAEYVGKQLVSDVEIFNFDLGGSTLPFTTQFPDKRDTTFHYLP